jgi:hypothetical protein
MALVLFSGICKGERWSARNSIAYSYRLLMTGRSLQSRCHYYCTSEATDLEGEALMAKLKCHRKIIDDACCQEENQYRRDWQRTISDFY